MKSSLLLRRCPIFLVLLNRMVCEMRGKWPYSCVCSRQCAIFFYSSCETFSQYILLVHTWNSIDTITAWKKSHFILPDGSEFHMIDNLSTVFHAFIKYILISLSVDEMLLLMFVNWSANFRHLALRVEMSPSCLKYILFYLHSFRTQCLSQLALGYTVEILLGQVYLWEALGCQHICICHSFWGISSASFFNEKPFLLNFQST